MPPTTPMPDVEPYPSELLKIRDAYAKLSKKFAYTRLTDTNLDYFLRTAAELFADVGFTVDVGLDQMYQDGKPTGWFIPEVTISGRVHPIEECDHDKLAWEITRGMADGQPGYIRADGSRHEDPISKNIV